MRRRPVRNLMRFKFKVARPGMHEIVVEQLAETREEARRVVSAFAAVHWPGSEVEP